MTKAAIVSLGKKITLENQASLWLIKLERGLNKNETKEFQYWITQDIRHYNCLLEYAEFWQATESFDFISGIKQELRDSNGSQSIYSKGCIASVAAVLTLFIFTTFAYFTYNPSKQKPEQMLFSTDFRSQNFNIEKSLPDGSILSLNSNTQVSVRYYPSRRDIILSSGEVFIDVEKDHSRPLTVYARGIFFRAVGTAFSVNIRSDKEQIEMVVSEGRVSYGKKDDSVNENNPSQKDNKTAQAGEMIVGTKSDFTFKTLNESELDQAHAWRSSYITFNGESIELALKEIVRHSEHKIKIEVDSLKHERVAGRFKIGDIEGFLNSLRDNYNITWREEDGTIYIEK